MAKIEDCPSFKTFGQGIKVARKAKHLTRQSVAETLNIAPRYLTNIENEGAIPSLPVMIRLIVLCGFLAERYFNPGLIRGDSEQRQRVSHKLSLCPEKYLPIIEATIDGAISMNE
ncbi:MAG: helix-turn-helix transcriptional regulator [Lawsonibacter sp.]|nr:helix-turn-helix transcriptional regulator [Lawsonibacter sp.]